jgi:hypothetical protein
MKTLRETKSGDMTLRLVQTASGFVGLVIKTQEIKAREDGADADDVWRRIHDAAARLNPLFIGYSSARARFLHFFRDGFADADYVAKERQYKVDAKTILEKAAPLASVESGADFGEGVLAAFKRTNLLASFEQMSVAELLRGPDADAFVRLCADFTRGDRKPALHALKTLLKPHDCAKWTIVTYLPFLWRPDEHFFLKPMMIKNFAERVGHRFARVYEADLDVEVYDALLDLAAETRLEIASLQPRDMIDIQSFMWTVIKYKEEDKVAPA